MQRLSVSGPEKIDGYTRYTVTCPVCRVSVFVELLDSLIAGNEEAIREELACRVANARRSSTVIAVRVLVDDAEPRLRRDLLVKKCPHVWAETSGSMPPVGAPTK
jgi:hypothetical protein